MYKKEKFKNPLKNTAISHKNQEKDLKINQVTQPEVSDYAQKFDKAISGYKDSKNLNNASVPDSDVSSFENDRGVAIVRPSESDYDIIAQQEFFRSQRPVSRNNRIPENLNQFRTNSAYHTNIRGRPISASQNRSSYVDRFNSRPLSSKHRIQHRPYIKQNKNMISKGSFNFEVRNFQWANQADNDQPKPDQMQIYKTMERVISQQNLASSYLSNKVKGGISRYFYYKV